MERAGLRNASIAADLQATFNDVMKLPGALSVISSSPDLIKVTELDTKLTRQELHSLQSVGKKDPVWVDWHDWIGKKHLGNFLLGQDAFDFRSALKSVTENVQVDCSAVDEQRMFIVDTRGFGDTRHMGTKNTEAENLATDASHFIVEPSKTIFMAQYGIHVFFAMVRADSRELFSTNKLLDLLDILATIGTILY